MLNKILKPLAQVQMARANGAVLVIFAFALVVFCQGFLKANLHSDARLRGRTTTYASLPSQAAVDGAEALALDTPSLRGLGGLTCSLTANDTVQIAAVIEDVDINDVNFMSYAADFLDSALINIPTPYPRCNIWQEISSDDPGLDDNCGATGSYLLITVDADDGITSSQIATALTSNSFEGLLCSIMGLSSNCTVTCTLSYSVSATTAPTSSSNSSSNSSSISSNSSSNSDSSSTTIIAIAVPIGIVGLCCLAFACRYCCKAPEAPMWPFWVRDPRFFDVPETNNNAQSAKTNGETMNEGKKETMNEGKKETMSEGPPVDSTTSTAITATKQQSDAVRANMEEAEKEK